MAEEIEPSSWRNYTRYQWTVLVVFGIVNMVSAMTYSTQAPFFPAEAERKNATALEYGLVIGIYELTAFIMCPLLGTYMYVIGPKTGFSVGVFVAGSSMVAFGFLDIIDDRIYFIGLALLLRVMQGTGASALFVSIYSFVTEAFPNSVATTFALMETFFGFGFCIGPVVGEALFHVGGFTLPFAALGGFMMVSPFFCTFSSEETRNVSYYQWLKFWWNFRSNTDTHHFSKCVWNIRWGIYRRISCCYFRTSYPAV
jgi:MFS family permease